MRYLMILLLLLSLLGCATKSMEQQGVDDNDVRRAVGFAAGWVFLDWLLDDDIEDEE